MPLLLKEAHDVRRTSQAQRLSKGLNGSCWNDGVIEAVGQEDGAVDLVHEIEGRAALVTREAFRERPNEALQLVLLELVRPPAELKQVNDAGHAAAGHEDVAEDQGPQGREAAGTGARDDGAGGIGSPDVGEPAGDGDAVLGIGDAPEMA
jgi:hypothetical protein